MGLFKADFYRFFAFGFAAGALLIAGTMEGDLGSLISKSVTPVAHAQTQVSE